MSPTIRRLADLPADERDRLMRRSLGRIFDPELWASVRSLYEDVAAAGDGALCAALQRFDGVDAEAGDLRVSDAELDGAGAKLAPALRDALDSMVAALRAYNERVLRDADWQAEIAPGVVVGERSRPIASAAIYVPCGKGSFPSVMAHLGVPAAVAGVPKLVVLCPPLRSTGRIDSAYLYIAAQLGLREVWRVNGPSGIAAAVLGSSSIPRVRKVVGPGSPAVTVAQLLAAEHGVATNMLQGPSESLILADDSADPALLALDLLTEAEHGPDSAATLVTWSEQLAAAVAAAVEPRLAALPAIQREHAAAALGDLGGILICSDEAEACAFANEYAVEHLQIATSDAQATLARIDYAAEILIGQNTPMAAANFTIGVPNTLPSGGYAAVSSGVTARTFLATSSIAELSARGLASVGPAARLIAEYEDFPAHASALRERGL
jgi:histidinol dehydrogenase